MSLWLDILRCPCAWRIYISRDLLTNLSFVYFIIIGKSGFVFPGLDGPALVGAKPVSIHKSAAREEAVVEAPPVRRRFPRIPALQVNTFPFIFFI